MDQQGRESKANEAQLGQFILRVFMSMWSTHGSLEPGCAKLPKDSRKRGEAVDMEGISRLLRGLPPMQEKVLRLYFGLGCKRTHTAGEMAEELGVSAQVIGGILVAGQRRLATEGLTFKACFWLASRLWAILRPGALPGLGSVLRRPLGRYRWPRLRVPPSSSRRPVASWVRRQTL
jgi:hypothetical protein